MEQHPIPQQISSYQFRLVGDMTLKQFFQVAGGVLVGLLFYSTPIIGIVKWPIVIVSVLLGVLLAFVPLEERPLERWIFAFFKAIYTPTEFYWKKSVVPPKYFQDEPVGPVTISVNAPQEKAVQEYLDSSSQKTGPLAKLEVAEKGFLSTLANMFTGTFGLSHKPASSGTPTTPSTNQTNPPNSNMATPNLNMSNSGSTTPPVPLNVPETQKTQEQSPELKIPKTESVKVVSSIPHLVVEERTKPLPAMPVTTQKIAPIIAGEEMVSTKQAMFSIDAAPPNPPSIPNVVVGQVVDENRKIVEGAIMEIKDSAGRPVRALRSNKAGHFMTVTPLENGRYDVVTEKDGYEFTTVGFEAVGALIPPILVQGKQSLQIQPAAVNQEISSLKNQYSSSAQAMSSNT